MVRCAGVAVLVGKNLFLVSRGRKINVTMWQSMWQSNSHSTRGKGPDQNANQFIELFRAFQIWKHLVHLHEMLVDGARNYKDHKSLTRLKTRRSLHKELPDEETTPFVQNRGSSTRRWHYYRDGGILSAHCQAQAPA